MTGVKAEFRLTLPFGPEIDPELLLDYVRFMVGRTKEEDRIADEELATFGLDPIDPESI